MTNFEKLCPLILFATAVYMDGAHASGKPPVKDDVKEESSTAESSATKIGKALGKAEKKAEHGYKEHVLEPTREVIKGAKQGHEEQKDKK